MRVTPASRIACRKRDVRVDVVVEIPLGHQHRLARRLVPREVHDLVHIVLADDTLHELGIGDVTDHKGRIEHSLAVAVLQGVEHDDLAARISQRPHRVRTDISRAAGHQNAHRTRRYPRARRASFRATAYSKRCFFTSATKRCTTR